MEKNNESSRKIVVNYNDNNYQFNIELSKPLNALYNELCSYFQINPNNFVLYFNEQKIRTDNNNQQLFNIIKNNSNLIFKIIPKKIKISQKLNLFRNSNTPKKITSITSRKKQSSNFLTISTQENIINKNRKNNIYGNASVIISKIPSNEDIQNILFEFNNKQNNNNNNHKLNNGNFENNNGFLTVLGNNSVRVDFKNESTLNEFISYISFIKYQNNYYKNIIIQKNCSSIRNNLRNLSYSKNNDRKENHKLNKRYNYSNSSKMLFSENNININDVIRALKQNELNNDCYHGLSLSRDGEDEIITDYYRQQNYLRNSSPYISENEKRILEEKENKKHFFKHKNFITSVGKYSMKPNFISNYVGMTPSENPKNHEFRNVDKNKWITNKGFNV